MTKGSISGLGYLRAVLFPLLSVYLVLGFLVRLGLWIVFRADSRMHVSGLLTAVGVGACNDLIEFLYLALPITIILVLVRQRFLGRRSGTILVGILLYVALCVFIFTAIAEVLFWEEFECRFNLIAVDYLIYPTEVVGNIRESYPMMPILVGIVALAGAVWWPMFRSIRRQLSLLEVPSVARRSRGALVHVGAVTALAFSLNAETLTVSTNRAVNELSKNGSATFFRAFLTQGIDYNQFYSTMPLPKAYETVRRYYEGMGEAYPSSDPTSLLRSHQSNPKGLGKMNVVILVQESLGAQFVGAYGSSKNLTPFLDSLSKESLMFSNAYATGTRTVRGLEAMSASFPPIPSESIVKRPGSDNISTMGSVMRSHGYHTSFLYGGYGAFDNMNAYFGSNGFSLSDRLDIKNPNFGNIWGVSDEDLYRHAIAYFDDLHVSGRGPFFSYVLSTSNHKPFTFPPGIPGVAEKGGGRDAGVRYADYAIGKFIEVAKTKPWFSNTIVVVIADHDSRFYGRAYIPVERYRIPALLYAPGKIAPQVVPKMFSSMDLGPTILGILGLSYEAPFYGVDVLSDRVPANKPVMFSHNHNIAIYAEGNLTVLGLQKEVRSFRYENGKTTDAPLDQASAELLTATLQTAYEKFTAHLY
jgi:phosphoglycerol transferase MdoB-like AlkP superfamily enzyme